MKISIITPSFNQGRFLEETILSILNQEYAQLEYIVVDGGSTDESLEIIKKYSSRISYWVSEKDKGQSDAINKGLEKATGDVVTWLNSDDLLLKNSLDAVSELFRKSDDRVGVVHGGTILFGEDGFTKEDRGYTDPSLERYLSGMAFPQPGAFIRKKYLDKVGPLNTSLHYGMDYDLFARLGLVSGFVKTDQLLSRYRLHDSSKSRAQSHLFIEDWIATYATVLFNLEQDEKYSMLQKMGLIGNNFQPVKFSFDFQKPAVDWELSFFYFLSYVLRSDYQNNQHSRAKAICRILDENYQSLFKQDKDLRLIAKRLKFFPSGLIKIVREIKNKR